MHILRLLVSSASLLYIFAACSSPTPRPDSRLMASSAHAHDSEPNQASAGVKDLDETFRKAIKRPDVETVDKVEQQIQ